MRGLRAVLALVVVVVLGIGIVGIAQGENEYQEAAEPTAQQTAQSRRQIDADPTARAGIRVFDEEGCDACHSLAAIGANGKLGPRLDAIDDEVEENVGFIASSRRGDDNIMPSDYGERMSREELTQVSTLINRAYVEGIQEEGGEEGEG